MIINVFGSTKNEVHFGCKSLTSGLEALVYQKYGNNAVVDHTLHKYLSPNFLEAFRKPKTIGRKTALKYALQSLMGKDVLLPKSKEVEVSLNKWKNSVDVILKDSFIKSKIAIADINIINVEGTIHDQNFYGLYLLALSKAIKELGKEVKWVNVTMQNESNDILKEAIGAETLPTREKYTFDYLKNNGLNPVESFDTAVLAPFQPIEKLTKTNGKVLVTGSVNKNVSVKDIIDTVQKLGKTPVYIPAGISDVADIEEVKKLGVESLSLGEVHFLDLPRYINEFDFVISGRHHLNILSAVAGKPFIPLMSNSWKTEGIVDFFGVQELYLENLDDAVNQLDSNFSGIQEKLLVGIERAKSLANSTCLL